MVLNREDFSPHHWVRLGVHGDIFDSPDRYWHLGVEVEAKNIAKHTRQETHSHNKELIWSIIPRQRKKYVYQG